MAMGRQRHTVVISDVHLSEAEPGDDAWLRYRQRRFFPDDDFAQLASLMMGRLRDGERLELVFDGDLIEFEGPKVIDGQSRFDDMPRTEIEAVDVLSRIVRDHPVFFTAVARVAAAGHQVVFVAGNHDVQLSFPAVQVTLRRAIAELLPSEPTVGEHVSVQPWFYQTDDRVHVEHGHQYDAYCSFRDPLHPLDVDGREIQPTVGSLAFRHLVSRMGYFNAYDERSFMLSVPRYLAHWARYYLFTRRSLALTWFRGALKVVAEVIRSRPRRQVLATIREQAALARATYAKMLALDAKALARHAELFAEPADEAPHRVVREMRLDHTALAVVGVAGLVTAAFKPRIGLLMALGALVVGVAQEIIAPKQPIHASYRKVDAVASSIAKIYDARAVVFGHTHVPHCSVEDGVVLANAGSWAPGSDETDTPDATTAMVQVRRRGRPVVWLRRPEDDPHARVEGGLYRLKDGALVPDSAVVDEPAEEEIGFGLPVPVLEPTG
jgi:UDP-2,3-diacylglucosamine pyrophosphatase LpxH